MGTVELESIMLTVILCALVFAQVAGFDKAHRLEPEHTKMSFSQCYRAFKPAMERDHVIMSNNEDAKQRVKYFRKAQKTINAINSDSSKSYTAEFNECSMLTEAEKLSFTGLNVSMSRDHEEMKLRKRRRTRSLELRASEKNWYPTHTTPVKNQGTCGSCWAFAGITVLESRAAINGGTLRQYSEQEIIDCNSSGSECQGGWYSTVWSYVKSAGRLASSADYGYNGVKGSCKSRSSSLDKLVASYDDYGGWNEADLVSDLLDGPVAIAVNANDNFMDYASGIFNEAVDTSPNHAVVAVGYTSSYFYVRNSWGANWGDGGYISLARGVCTSLTYSYYS